MMIYLEIDLALDWLRKANKYIERQYKSVKDWNGYGLIKVDNYDELFIKEFTFIIDSVTQSNYV